MSPNYRPLHMLCALLAVLIITAVALPVQAITREQIISRENPTFDCARARLSVGRDGKVYLCSTGNNSYAMRLNPDGTGKYGGPIVYAVTNAVANADGVLASANGHFAHKVALYDTKFNNYGANTDFLVGDKEGWDAPAYVAAGASGDFYGVDQHRDRVVRLTATGKVVTNIPVLHQPDGGAGNIYELRVCEPVQAIYVMGYLGLLRCIGFDGKVRWSLNPGVSYNSWSGGNGGWDVDDAGNVYIINGTSDTVQVYTPDGKPGEQFTLKMGALKPTNEQRITALQVWKGDVFIKRWHPTELFQRYALATGELKTVAVTDHEKLAVTYPTDAWTAGEAVPFAIEFNGGARTITPHWRVWVRPFGGTSYIELPVKDGAIKVPNDFAGIYQFKVTPEAQPIQRGTASEYLVQGLIEVKQPGAAGTASVLTPDNRIYYGRGEEIPVKVTFRSLEAALPATAKVSLWDMSRIPDGKMLPVAEATLKLQAGTRDYSLRLAKGFTAALNPGVYLLTVAADKLTSIPQRLQIGPGLREPAFHTVDYGDYGPTYLANSDVWEAPDVVAQFLHRNSLLGFNLMVDRLGQPLQFNAFSWYNMPRPELDALKKRLTDDQTTTAPEKVSFAPPFLQTMAGYGAFGVQQMSILMANDAGLPLDGPGFDGRKPDQILADFKKAQMALAPFPAFRGWSWSSNWWIFEKSGANAATTPEDKAAYLAALKQVNEVGAWDPVLDKVANTRLNFAVDAQRLFNDNLRAVSPNLVTASACPYRNVESYPPISLSNVQETDLQAQWEQIAVPYASPHNVDFYTRPGKRSWGHPEIWNDAGTGDQIVPTLFQMVMRGADGVGLSGHVLNWNAQPEDPRLSDLGAHSVYRALNGVLNEYGPWFTRLQNNDKVAIIADGRMFKTDAWKSVWGLHFVRVKEAYASCLHAHYPASIVFVEDLTPDLLKKYKAVLLVDQRVEMEPALATALRYAKAAGTAIFYDGTCRERVVEEFAPLGISFNKFEKDPSPAGDDNAYLRFPAYCRENLPALNKALGGVMAPAAGIDQDEVFISERKSGDGRVLFVVNNANLPLESGHMWRTTLSLTSRLPLRIPVRLGADAKNVYDLFDLKQVASANGAVTADLRTLPARVFAILPAPIARVGLRGPKTVQAGKMLAWTVYVQDAAGKPIRMDLPVRVRMLTITGTVLDEMTTAADAAGASGTFTAPLNAGSTVTLEVTELCSGKVAQLKVPVLPALLALTDAPAREAAAADAVAFGNAAGKLAPAEDSFGPHVRDMVVSADGALAVMNTNNWDHNLYALDTATGQVRWRGRAGQYFAFAPQALANGVAVQGFDFKSAEGYHLYLAGNDGKFERRFALYGLPVRLPHRFVPAMLHDRTDSFAVPADGRWVASAGDMGVVVWSRDGKELWRQDWWKTKRHAATLAALDADTLLVAEGMTVTAYGAQTGEKRWSLELANTGEVRTIKVSRDGSTAAVLSTTEGGRVFVLRQGKVTATFITPVNDLDMTADGAFFAVSADNQVKLYALNGGLQWTFSADETARFPRFSRDGKRIAAASDLGSTYVLDQQGNTLMERDMGALAAPAWLPNGDLLLGGWEGTVCRLDGNYAECWRVHLQPEETNLAAKALTDDGTPTTKVASWSNADEVKDVALTPNLLAQTPSIIKLVPSGGWGGWAELQNKAELLYDGKTDAPPQPWLAWDKVGFFAETSPFNYLLIDTVNKQLRVNAITLVEDTAHPESWLRDATFEYWDPAKEQWISVQPLLSNSAVHTHTFAKPVEAARFRIVLPWGLYGNLRLAEVVFHGEIAGNSHPDVAAKKPVAVLFDEGDDELKCLQYANNGCVYKFVDAFSGGRFLAMTKEGSAGPSWQPPFGHVVPNWDFPIAETPQPGQYRFLQFAWKATDPTTKTIAFTLQGVTFYAGEDPKIGGVEKQIADTSPTEWTQARVDLWELLKRPVSIQSISLTSRGGGMGIDRILLGRTEADLPPLK